MTYPVDAVAAQIRARLPGVPVKKLHKLLYYAQGYHLATFSRPLFSESVMAWDMGPVVGSLWYAEKDKGPSDQGIRSQLDEGALNTIGWVISRYGHLSGNDLEHLTHAEAPWQEANRERPPKTSVRIPVESIQDYFIRSAADEDGDETLDADVISEWLTAARPMDGEGVPDSLEALKFRVAGSA